MHVGQAWKPGNSRGIFCRQGENLRPGFYPAFTETGFRLVLALSNHLEGLVLKGFLPTEYEEERKIFSFSL
jgi:hypothetical protein